MHDLYLIRHGQSCWNATGRMQGRLDSPLTDHGRAQARALAPLIAGIEADRVSSPQGRAVESAGLIFGGAAFSTDPRLVEIDIGIFSGRFWPDIQHEAPEIFAPPRLAWYDRCPGGEGFQALERRCADWLASLTGPTIAVTHGVTLRMLRRLALGLGMEIFQDMPVEQGAIHVIRGGEHAVWRPETRLAP